RSGDQDRAEYVTTDDRPTPSCFSVVRPSEWGAFDQSALHALGILRRRARRDDRSRRGVADDTLAHPALRGTPGGGGGHGFALRRRDQDLRLTRPWLCPYDRLAGRAAPRRRQRADDDSYPLRALAFRSRRPTGRAPHFSRSRRGAARHVIGADFSS